MTELLDKFALVGDLISDLLDTAKNRCQISEIPFGETVKLLKMANQELENMIEIGKEIQEQEEKIYGKD